MVYWVTSVAHFRPLAPRRGARAWAKVLSFLAAQARPSAGRSRASAARAGSAARVSSVVPSVMPPFLFRPAGRAARRSPAPGRPAPTSPAPRGSPRAPARSPAKVRLFRCAAAPSRRAARRLGGGGARGPPPLLSVCRRLGPRRARAGGGPGPAARPTGAVVVADPLHIHPTARPQPQCYGVLHIRQSQRSPPYSCPGFQVAVLCRVAQPKPWAELRVQITRRPFSQRANRQVLLLWHRYSECRPVQRENQPHPSA